MGDGDYCFLGLEPGAASSNIDQVVGWDYIRAYLFHYGSDSWSITNNGIGPAILVAHAVELDVLCCSVRSNMA